MAEVRRLKFLEGVVTSNPISYSVSEEKREGIVNLSLGDSSKAITFSTPYANANYVPIISFICDDADPIFLNYKIQNITVNGFTVKLNAPVDSNNYKIAYRVSDPL